MQTDRTIIPISITYYDGEQEILGAWDIRASQRAQIQQEINKIKESLEKAGVPLWVWDSDMYLEKIREKFPDVEKINYCFWERLEI